MSVSSVNMRISLLIPHFAGNVQIGEGTWIGAGTIVIPGVRIGRWSVIGAGSVVTKDIPDGVLAVGNRCKIIKALNTNALTNKDKSKL